MAKKPRKGMSLDMPPEVEETGRGVVSREEIIDAAPIKKGSTKGVDTAKVYLAHKRINLPIIMQKKMEEIAKARGFIYFTVLLKHIFEEYLENPINQPKFKLVEIDDSDGEKKNRDVRLPPQMIDSIQERAKMIYAGNFSGLAQEIIKGWLKHHKYL
jgi:hypothetical protein